MSGSYDEAIERLRAQTLTAETLLLQRTLEKRRYKGLTRLNLNVMVKERGVRGAQRAALYFSNVLREASTPAIIEFALALFEKSRCERDYYVKGWLTKR